jgi:N-acyl-D-amino-acid deacylase
MIRRLLVSLPLIACILCAGTTRAAYDVVFRNGRIIDGAGNCWFHGDVAVQDGRIAAMGFVGKETDAAREIDLQDSYITPGFIDVHTHCEDDLLSMPMAENFIRMGVTSVVMGNCGDSYSNLREGFTSHTLKGSAVNIASLIGHNPIRRKVMGNVARDPSTTELEAMRKLVAKGMKDGAVGISTGLIYPPGVFAKTPEIIELAKVAGSYHGIYTTHMRGEGSTVFESIEEALTVGREAHLPVEISHFKIVAPVNFGKASKSIGMVESARASGMDVTADQYAYVASSTGINTMLPDWAVEGTSATVRARLKDPETRRRIVEGIITERRDKQGRKDMGYAHISRFRADPSLDGKSILEIAKLWKHDTSWQAQAETVADIITSGGAGMVFFSMDENDVREFAQYPNVMFASDSGVREFGVGQPHPRGYGNNVRVLAHYVRDEKVLRLEDAIRKMTSLPTQTYRFFDRGLLRPGMAADIVTFDLAKLKEASTFEKPHAYAEGFDHVMVNGKFVIDGGKLSQEKPGRILYGPARVEKD